MRIEKIQVVETFSDEESLITSRYSQKLFNIFGAQLNILILYNMNFQKNRPKNEKITEIWNGKPPNPWSEIISENRPLFKITLPKFQQIWTFCLAILEKP